MLWVRRGTAERPSPLRVCSTLSNNALTGSVPSSLSALTNLEALCVPPFLPPALVCAAEEGLIGRLCSERTASGSREVHLRGMELMVRQ